MIALMGSNMTVLSLVEALELCKTAKLAPYMTFDEILETSGGNGVDEEFSVWLDFYLIAKHPNGGEIYTQLYVDAFMQSNGEMGFKFNDDSLSIQTEDLSIEGVENLLDDLLEAKPDEFSSLLHIMNPCHPEFNEDSYKQLIEFCKISFKELFGETYTVDSIKSHEKYVQA